MNRYKIHQRNHRIKELLASVPLVIITTLLLGSLVLSVLNSISPLNF